MSVEPAEQQPLSRLLDAVRDVGDGSIVRGTDLLPHQLPVYVGLEPVGGRWLRLDTSAGSALVRAEAGLSLDHDRDGLRIRARDGREYLASGVDDTAFEEIVRLVGATANRPVGEEW